MELVKKIRMPLDIAMTVLSVILMGGMSPIRLFGL